jgi:hypothetical protein
VFTSGQVSFKGFQSLRTKLGSKKEEKQMRMTNIALIFTGLGFAANMAAQVPRFEVSGNYSYMQFNPTISGVQSRAFNGGGGAVQMNFMKFLGVKGEFEGYGSTNVTATFATPVTVNPLGTIPAGTFKSQGNMFTYLFGPTVNVHHEKFTVFGELLFGGSNTNMYGNLSKSIDLGGGTIAVQPTQHPFTMAFGGGFDVNIHKHIALRLGEVDWILTRYTNPLTQTNNQNSFRYLGGVVFRFGGE